MRKFAQMPSIYLVLRIGDIVKPYVSPSHNEEVCRRQKKGVKDFLMARPPQFDKTFVYHRIWNEPVSVLNISLSVI